MIVVGLISGTSADGIDVGIADISHTNSTNSDTPDIKLNSIHFETIPWSDSNREIIFAIFLPTSTVVDVCRANFILAEAFADAALRALNNADIKPESVSIIASHGQTVWHDVKDGKVTSTLQIGEGAVIAARTGITTISNFRVADVAFGGQGAPLASTIDYLLLQPTGNKWRALQNIGGIGNVSFIPPKQIDKDPLAFDTGPGNVLMDGFCSLISNGTLKYDEDGKFGRQGKVNNALLEELLAHPYLSQVPPKSTGRELYTKQFVANVAQKAKETNIPDNDVVATLTEFTAVSIVDSYKKWAPGSIGEVVIGGGGGNNPFLLERIKAHLETLDSDIKLWKSEDLGVSSDGKEAYLFALLGYLCFHGLPGNIPKCTGAKEQAILGCISPGKNFKHIVLN